MDEKVTIEKIYDPSPLTREVMRHEIGALRDLLWVRIDGLDKAIAVAHDNLTRVPTEVDKAVGHLSSLMDAKVENIDTRFGVFDERLLSIQTQFKERDVRTEQSARDSKVAVDAALQAAKEAVAKQNDASGMSIAKSETATTKQIDQLAMLISSSTSALNDKITDVKDRIVALESSGRGAKEQGVSYMSIISLVIGSLIGLGGLVMAIASKYTS